MRFQIEVMVWRGDIAESVHHCLAAACDSEGTIVASTERPDRVTTFRSAAKPFQLLPLVERGHAERWGWSDEQLAVMAASHTGSAYHVDLVKGILDRLELSERDLACGIDDPIDPESLQRVRTDPSLRSPLYNNCSGKHAGMLCLARSEGWPTAGYHAAEHPVQQLMRRTIAELCGLSPEAVAIAIDGCSVSVFAVPLANMARAYARLAAATPAGDGRERALARIRESMVTHPRAVGGAGRLSTTWMEAASGRLVAKGGAEGLECLGLPAARLGVAVKCEDGNSRAMGPASAAVLELIGGLPAMDSARLETIRRPVVRNVAGMVVGRIEATARSLSSAPA